MDLPYLHHPCMMLIFNITVAAESLPIILTSLLHYANTSCYSNLNLMML